MTEEDDDRGCSNGHIIGWGKIYLCENSQAVSARPSGNGDRRKGEVVVTEEDKLIGSGELWRVALWGSFDNAGRAAFGGWDGESVDNFGISCSAKWDFG